MVDRAYERSVFQALVEFDRGFLGEELADWSQLPDERDFPDIIATTASGRRLGVELAEWLNQDETAASRSTEKAQAAMLAVVGPQRANTTVHVGHVWLSRKPGSYVRPADIADFREQLCACISHCDSDGSIWDSPAGHSVASSELAPYPALAKYLNGLRLRRRKPGESWPEGVGWIGFPARIRCYSVDTMLQPLLQLVDRKRRHYPRGCSDFNHLSLVVFYNRALLYNSPVETLDFTFEDAARMAGDLISGDPGPFDCSFVFDATCPKRLLRAYP